MRLTRDEHHKNLRAPIRDISYWFVNADVSALPPPCHVSAREIAPPLRMYLHDYRCLELPPTTTSCLLRLPAPSHDYLQPSTITCYQPLVPRCACLEKDLRYFTLDYFYNI